MAGPSPRGDPAPRGANGASFNQAVAWLRRAEQESAAGTVLGVLGATLAVAGLVWGLWQLVAAHPYLICIGAGLATLMVSALARPGGLLSCFPQAVQDALLQLTIFDLLYDDSAMQNLLRKWGRIGLLLAARSPGDVQAVTAGLDPAFVDGVLRRTFIYWLPAGMRTILLPAQMPSGRVWPKDSPEARVQEAAVAGVGAAGLPFQYGGPPLTPQRISALLRHKDQVRDRLITEAPLVPVVVQVFGVRPVLLGVASAVLRQARLVLSAAAVGCALCAAALRLPAGHAGFLRALALRWSGEAQAGSAKSDAVLLRARQVTSALGLLSAGGAIVVMMFYRRLTMLQEAGPPARAAEPQAASEARNSGAAARVGELEAALAEARAREEASAARALELQQRLAQSEARNVEVAGPSEEGPVNGARRRTVGGEAVAMD